jgi:thiamine biosynthesis lipoprotein
MATRFELVLCGDDPVFLRAAGEEALDEVERLERQLSLYRPDSELSGLNARAAVGPVVVEPRFFRLLERVARLSDATEGAFDPTVTPLMRCWGLMGRGPLSSSSLGPSTPPEAHIVAAARECVGMRYVALDPVSRAVRFLRPGMSLDLGAVGKGYAIEQASVLLREAGVASALLHAGTSTVAAIGAPPDADAWKVAIRHPHAPERSLASVALRDRALSVSAPHGKSYTIDGRRYGHVLDPRTGVPVQGALLAAVVTDSPTDGDALSTGLLVLGAEGLPLLRRCAADCRALVALAADDDACDGEPRVLLLEEGEAPVFGACGVGKEFIQGVP